MNRWLPPVLLVFALMAATFVVFQTAKGPGETVNWTELKKLVADDKIESVVFDGELVRARRKGEEGARVLSVRVDGDESFIPLLESKGVSISKRAEYGCANGSGLLVIVGILLMGGFFVMMMLRMDNGARGAAAFGRSPAALVPEEGTGITFSDVAGVEEAAEELMEIVSFLKTPERFTALGGRPPKGVLLIGPPGTGKTLLARAVAGEAGVPFFSISGSSFVEMFVGVGAARVRDLFQNAKNHAPCIIFIDELDAVGRSRQAGPGGNDEREQTLNQLLVEMDGFDNTKGVILLAATNRPEVLDPALLRAGRFDRQVLVDRPDVAGRLAILEVHARKLKLERDLDLHEVAKLTPGFAGAELANVLNEAALLAARLDHSAISLKDIGEAIERVMAGLEKKNRRLGEEEKRTVAFHECGHAICAAATPHSDPVKKITIIPRGMAALGYTLTMPDEERYLQTKAKLLDRVTVLFGGRAAEEIVFGDVTTGAYDDIRKATDIARRMVTEFGMSKTLGTVRYGGDGQGNAFGLGGPGGQPLLSPETAEAIEQEVRGILDRCHERALEILHANRLLLEEMSMALVEREVLDGEEMQAFLDRADPADDLADPPTAELRTV